MKKIIIILLTFILTASAGLSVYASPSVKDVKQFDLTASEFINRFNAEYGSRGMTLITDKSRDDCYLGIRGERTDIRVQFCDRINGPFTTGCGLDMEKWNWLYAYIVTDDYSCDWNYFSSFPQLCSCFAAILGCHFTQEQFVEGSEDSGSSVFPVMSYTKDGIRNTIQFRDTSVGNYHQTVYNVSIEVVQGK